MARPKKAVRNASLFQPCCGFFLQGCVKALAILDVGVECGMIVLHASGIYATYREYQAIDGVDKYARHIHWGFHFAYNIISLLMSYHLHKYATTRDTKGLKKWLIISWVLFIPAVALFAAKTFWIGWKESAYMCFAGCGIFIPYKLYGLWVVNCFLEEVRYYGGFNSALSGLSDADVQDFFEGHKGETSSISQDQYGYDEKPYKRDFEIPLSQLCIDQNCQLGKGAYGTVFKGTLQPAQENMATGCCVVAVKTISQNAPVCYLKALLSELKILSYLGKHENVVNLVGACTSKIRNRQLYIIVEFCPMGSLLNYLKSTRGLFVNMFHTNTNADCGYTSPNVMTSVCGPSTIDILKWSMQTAAGMEYIASKKVIHGDLAARNILLANDMQVKIADFGLSRQLYQCYNYRKNSDEPLPWRWLAIESLTDLDFSTQSDVWAFGITIWEFFTCGEVPYGSQFTYSSEFLGAVQSNLLRLEQPPYASADIYQIMLSCWNLTPDARPSFEVLKYCFQQLYLRQLDLSGVKVQPVIPPKDANSPYISIDGF